MREERLQRRSSKQIVYEHLRERLRSDALPPGTALASVRQLSEMFGTSTRTVQEVPKRLTDEGLVYRKPHVGSFVAEPELIPPASAIVGRGTDKRVLYLQPGAMLGVQNLAHFGVALHAIERSLQEHDIQLSYSPLVYTALEEFLKREAHHIGVVIVPVVDYLYMLARRFSLPCVGLIDLPPEGPDTLLDGVTADNMGGAKAATWHLISLGHRRICFIGGGMNNTSTIERLEGYTQALEEAEIAFAPELILQSRWTMQGGYEAMLGLLARRADFTAVFAFNDFTALGAMRAIQETGRRIPDDMSVVGFEDLDFAHHTYPALTTMRVDWEQFGRTAALLARERLANKHRPGRIQREPVQLVERSSAGAISDDAATPPASYGDRNSLSRKGGQ